jgi:hypothetical protein
MQTFTEKTTPTGETKKEYGASHFNYLLFKHKDMPNLIPLLGYSLLGEIQGMSGIDRELKGQLATLTRSIGNCLEKPNDKARKKELAEAMNTIANPNNVVDLESAIKNALSAKVPGLEEIREMEEAGVKAGHRPQDSSLRVSETAILITFAALAEPGDPWLLYKAMRASRSAAELMKLPTFAGNAGTLSWTCQVEMLESLIHLINESDEKPAGDVSSAKRD